MTSTKILVTIITFISISINAQLLTQSDFDKLGAVAASHFNTSSTMLKSKFGEALLKTEFIGETDKSETKIGVTIGTLDPESIRSAGFEVNAVFDDFVTSRVKISDLTKLTAIKQVNYVSIGETLYPHNDVAVASTGASLIHAGYINGTTYTGSGVIVCIIDTGIDWEHLDFRDASTPTTSRILNIWDQTLTAGVGENPPSGVHSGNADFSGFTYGVEYTKSDIEDEIDGLPASFVRTEDTNGHGTHVAGTAAGNGASLSTNKYKGMAPETDIIVVKAGNGSFSSTNIKNGIAWAEAIADEAGKPVVINMSLGGHGNAHDGTSSQERAVDSFADAGKVAVISAGNEGSTSMHITGTISNASSVNISITVPSHTPNAGVGDDFFGFDLWHDTSADITVTVTSPNSQVYSRTTGTSGTSETSDGSIYIFNNTDSDYTNGDTRNYCFIDDYDSDPGVGVTNVNVAAGTWTINIQNNSGATRTYHGWLFTSNLGGSSATLTGGNSNYTVGSPGTATEAITVGSHVERWRWSDNTGSGYSGGTENSDDISTFSSIGPRRDAVQKPDITAHGDKVGSSTSQDYTPSSSRIAPGSKHHFNQGTSMSSPVVAGFVALLLQQNTSRTAAECKSLITGNADVDSYTGAVPNNTWGYGKLNGFEAMAKAVNSGFTVDRTSYIYDDWSNDNSTGIGASVMLGVKFTPSTSGTVTGLFFHTSTTVNFTGNMSLEIWSDNGSGLPDTKLGSTVSFSVDNILPFSWNYVNMSGAGVTATSATNYHAVLYFTSGTSLFIRHDNSNSGRNSINTGTWAAFTDGDLRIRPFVSTPSSSLPVELIAFNAIMNEGRVLLDWQTATEVNNYGFEIERTLSSLGNYENGQWENIGFVQGHGNSNSPKSYEFIDDNPPIGSLKYRLKQIDTDGSFQYYGQTSEVANGITNVENEQLPEDFQLSQNYPNPFNPRTKIEFAVPEDSRVKLVVYNSLGQLVTILVDQNMHAGYYNKYFDADALSSGMYIYRLVVNGKAFKTNKMVLLK